MAHAASSPPAARVVALLGGLVFIASLLYFVYSFAFRFGRPASGAGSTLAPALVDIALFTVFALHHSVFARTGVKAWLMRHAPPDLERSIYVWVSSLLFIAVCAWWRPVPGVYWDADGWLAMSLTTLQAAGGVAAVAFARQLDVLDLAGVRQVWRSAPAPPAAAIQDRGGYGLVRHPIYLAWLVVVWAAPVMTGTRLVFAAVSSAYLVVAIPIEERSLVRAFGEDYEAYRRRVRWRMIPGLY
jgi:protein-S-isoprenylcysteine O-methyltransferase Ste14